MNDDKEKEQNTSEKEVDSEGKEKVSIDSLGLQYETLDD